MSLFSEDKEAGLSLAGNVFWNSVGSLFYLGCNWLLTVFVVVMSDDTTASGSLAVAMSVGNVLSAIALFRAKPVQVAADDTEYSNSDFLGFRCLTILIGLICCAVYSLFTVSISSLFAVFLYMVFKAVESYIDVLQGIEQRASRLDLSAYSQIMRGVTVIASFIVGFTVFKSLEAAVGLMALTSAIVLFAFDHRCACRLVGGIRPAFSYRTLQLIKVCFPGFVGSLLITLVVSFVRQLFSLHYGEAELGVYAAIAAPTVIIQALANFIYAPLYGPLASLYEKRSFGAMNKILLKFVLIVCACVSGACLASLLFGKWAVGLIYGAQIAARWQALYPMLWATGFSAGASFILDLLLIVRSYWGAMVSSLVSFAVAVGLSYGGILTNDINSISYVVCAAFAMHIVLGFCFYLSSTRSRCK